MTTKVTVNSVQELVEYLDSGVDPDTWFYGPGRLADRVASAEVLGNGSIEIYVFPTKFKAALSKRIMAEYKVTKVEDDYDYSWGWGRLFIINSVAV